MLEALQRVLGQLDLAYCVLEKQKIVWANSQFLKFHNKNQRIIGATFSTLLTCQKLFKATYTTNDPPLLKPKILP